MPVVHARVRACASVGERGQTSSVSPFSLPPMSPSHPLSCPTSVPQAPGTPTPARSSFSVRVSLVSLFLAVDRRSISLSLSLFLLLALAPSLGRPLERTRVAPLRPSVILSLSLALSLSLGLCLRYRRGNLGSPWHRRYLLIPTYSCDRTYRPHYQVDPTTSTSGVIPTTTSIVVYYYHCWRLRRRHRRRRRSGTAALESCHHYMPAIRGRPRRVARRIPTIRIFS